MNASDAHQLLADLRDETARLGDPAELQFVGGNAAADAMSLDALVAQRSGVPALRLQGPALATATGRPVAEVLAEVAAYDGALGAAIEALRSGRAPVTARRSQAARSSQAAPRDPDVEHGHGPGLASAELAPPSWRRGALVAVVVLVLVVLVFVLLL